MVRLKPARALCLTLVCGTSGTTFFFLGAGIIRSMACIVCTILHYSVFLARQTKAEYGIYLCPHPRPLPWQYASIVTARSRQECSATTFSRMRPQQSGCNPTQPNPRRHAMPLQRPPVTVYVQCSMYSMHASLQYLIYSDHHRPGANESCAASITVLLNAHESRATSR